MTRTSTGWLRVAPTGRDLALLKRAEQLGLKRERELGDLVEQQRAAVRGAEQPLARSGRAGEAALLVTEQHRLQHGLGKRRRS
jgi:hypothetical protein